MNFQYDRRATILKKIASLYLLIKLFQIHRIVTTIKMFVVMLCLTCHLLAESIRGGWDNNILGSRGLNSTKRPSINKGLESRFL